MSEANEQSTMRSWKKPILIFLVALLLLGAAYLAAYVLAGNRVPKNVAVAGTPIGGLSAEEAEGKLRAELGPAREQPLVLVGPEGASTQIVPAEAGLAVDYAATLSAAGFGRSWNPTVIIGNLLGENPDAALIVDVDEGALEAALAAQADDFAIDPVPATLDITSGAVERTESTPGVILDVAETLPSVVQAFTEGSSEVPATVIRTEPEVTSAMVDEAVASFADPVLSGPVVLTLEEDAITIPVEKIAAVASFEVKDGALAGSIDTAELFKAIAVEPRDLMLTAPQEASYALENGTPVVVPSVTGHVLDETAFAETVNTLILGVGEAGRTGAMTTTVTEPEFDTEAATQVLPRQVIGEFTTQFPHADYRNTNLGTAAKKVNGTVLMPGETFSLDKTLGPRTWNNGFVDGNVIDGGQIMMAAGGGISQAATTLYNAAFFAGYEDIQHKPHSLYFDRYPAGREATIVSGALDMSFRNNTEYPAVIQGSMEPSAPGKKGSLTFKIWSIPTWERVTSTEIKKSGFYSGTTRTLPANEKCKDQAPIEGFTATWSRQFWKDGTVVKTENYSWKYNAGDKIVCAS